MTEFEIHCDRDENGKPFVRWDEVRAEWEFRQHAQRSGEHVAPDGHEAAGAVL